MTQPAWIPALSLILLPAVSSADVAEFDAYDPPEATLVFPEPGAAGVAPGTLVFATSVTAVELEGPAGERVPALLDPVGSVLGTVFAPMEDLASGSWRVMALPTADTWNYAGDGVAVEIGGFEVAETADTQAPVVVPTTATWTFGDVPDDVDVEVTLTGHVLGEPVRFEVDLADVDTAFDGIVDASSAWTRGSSFYGNLGGVAPEIEPESARVRIRAEDASDNVGPWSEDVPFQMMRTTHSYSTTGACRAAPGPSATSAAVALVAIAAVLLARRGRRES